MKFSAQERVRSSGSCVSEDESNSTNFQISFGAPPDQSHVRICVLTFLTLVFAGVFGSLPR